MRPIAPFFKLMALANCTALVLDVVSRIHPLICWLSDLGAKLNARACGTTPKGKVALALALCSLRAGAAVRS